MNNMNNMHGMYGMYGMYGMHGIFSDEQGDLSRLTAAATKPQAR
ncbi:hypothetical protein ALQ25_200240 [Pseudomonas coronafaciens pv. atropurpurea]|nr:hypothetical protein ALQ25_200240 [Pseudomonas coronafaciens pv. atropurpurea]